MQTNPSSSSGCVFYLILSHPFLIFISSDLVFPILSAGEIDPPGGQGQVRDGRAAPGADGGGQVAAGAAEGEGGRDGGDSAAAARAVAAGVGGPGAEGGGAEQPRRGAEGEMESPGKPSGDLQQYVILLCNLRCVAFVDGTAHRVRFRRDLAFSPSPPSLRQGKTSQGGAKADLERVFLGVRLLYCAVLRRVVGQRKQPPPRDDDAFFLVLVCFGSARSISLAQCVPRRLLERRGR